MRMPWVIFGLIVAVLLLAGSHGSAIRKSIVWIMPKWNGPPLNFSKTTRSPSGNLPARDTDDGLNALAAIYPASS